VAARVAAECAGFQSLGMASSVSVKEATTPPSIVPLLTTTRTRTTFWTQLLLFPSYVSSSLSSSLLHLPM